MSDGVPTYHNDAAFRVVQDALCAQAMIDGPNPSTVWIESGTRAVVVALREAGYIGPASLDLSLRRVTDEGAEYDCPWEDRAEARLVTLGVLNSAVYAALGYLDGLYDRGAIDAQGLEVRQELRAAISGTPTIPSHSQVRS